MEWALLLAGRRFGEVSYVDENAGVDRCIPFCGLTGRRAPGLEQEHIFAKNDWDGVCDCLWDWGGVGFKNAIRNSPLIPERASRRMQVKDPTLSLPKNGETRLGRPHGPLRGCKAGPTA